MVFTNITPSFSNVDYSSVTFTATVNFATSESGTLDLQVKIVNGETFATMSDKIQSSFIQGGSGILINETLASTPSSILVNIIGRNSGQTATLFNITQTFQFTGTAPPPSSPTTDMIILESTPVIAFDGTQNTVSGAVKATTTDKFNSIFGTGVQIIAQIKDSNGVILKIDSKIANFTGSGESSNNFYNFGIGTETKGTVEAFAFTSDNQALALQLSIPVDLAPPPPPTELANEAFTVTFSDASVLNFILSDTDFATLTARPPVVEFFVSVGTDTSLNPQTLASVDAAISAKLASLPTDDVKLDMVTINVNNSVSLLSTGTAHIELSLLPQGTLFNPFWLNKPITLFSQVKSIGGTVEQIIETSVTIIDDITAVPVILDIPTALTRLKIDFFLHVSATDPRPFALPVTLEMQEGVAPPPPVIVTAKTGLLQKLFGAFLIGTTLTLLTGREVRRRGKKKKN